MDVERRRSQSPRDAIHEECQRRGRARFVQGCIDLLGGVSQGGAALVFALGGMPARWVVTGEPSGPDRWLRVLAARGLLWEWDDAAAPAVVAALSDQAWRVREMAAKVVRRHLVVEAFDRVAALRDDPNHRVRAAA